MERCADLRPSGREEYEWNRDFLEQRLDNGDRRFSREYFQRLHPRVFNTLTSRDALVSIDKDKAVIDSDAVEKVLEGLKEAEKEDLTKGEVPFYKFNKNIEKRAYRDGYNYVRGKDSPSKQLEEGIISSALDSLFMKPERIEKSEFGPDEVKEVLEGDKRIEKTDAFKKRDRRGFISREKLLYFGTTDELAGGIVTGGIAFGLLTLNKQKEYLENFSGIGDISEYPTSGEIRTSIPEMTAAIMAGAYAVKSAAGWKSAYDEGIKKGVEDELHELGSWMKMEQLEGKKVQIETGNVPDANQVKLGEEPYFNY